MVKIKEVRRTCKRCKTEWYLPKDLAKERAPNKMQLAGAKMQAVGAAGSIVPGLGLFSKSRKRAQAQALADRRIRVLENSRCPNCGSVEFEQIKV